MHDRATERRRIDLPPNRATAEPTTQDANGETTVMRRTVFSGRGSAAPEYPAPACGNRLLEWLGESDRAMLKPGLTQLELLRGAPLFEPGDDVLHTYFPQDSTMVSLVIIMPDGKIAEAATVGREGAVGGMISLGHKPAFSRAVVQIQGPALRIETDLIEEAKHRSPSFRDVFARYADCHAGAGAAIGLLQTCCTRWRRAAAAGC